MTGLSGASCLLGGLCWWHGRLISRGETSIEQLINNNKRKMDEVVVTRTTEENILEILKLNNSRMLGSVYILSIVVIVCTELREHLRSGSEGELAGIFGD